MDLMGGYLLIILVLFSVNIALLMGNFKLSNFKVIMFSLIYAVISFALMNISNHLNFNLLDYFAGIFLIIAISVFSLMILYTRKDKLMPVISAISGMFFISVILFSSQSDLVFFDSILYSLFVFVIIFFVYQLSKLLVHAKRDYPIIIGEYMVLFSVLMFIFTLTYYSTLTLDYTMFSAFLILTPTYQLIYVIIGIVVVMVIGVLLNDVKGGKS